MGFPPSARERGVLCADAMRRRGRFQWNDRAGYRDPCNNRCFVRIMAGLVPAIHVFD
jgi:hypothetical protein